MDNTKDLANVERFNGEGFIMCNIKCKLCFKERILWILY